MESKLMISYRWKRVGWLLAVPALIAGLYYIANDYSEALVVTVPEWLDRILWIDGFPFDSGKHQIALLDELIGLTLLLGLVLLAFSREKIEDEWIQRVRLESFQWAILTNTLLLMGFIIFTHGAPFFTVMVYNMFTPLLIFVARFYSVLYLKPLFTRQES